ncbi:hypothetical protein [Streptomyces sp. NPDC020983]|uniref:hypothetical protein n=1 Tax=Streptomyces sp. NPDC020983 TaxID=3365106 RepID=UPI0037A4D2E7
MSDGGFDFELEPYKDGPEHGVRGTVGSFGRVQIFHTVGKWKSGDVFRASLTGERLPATSLTSRGIGGEPSVTNAASLDVGGVTADLRYNMLGISRAQRALRIRLADRVYRLTKTAAPGGSELRREGVRVTLANGRRAGGPGSLRMRNGAVRGRADATDLAVALIFEATSVSSLSVGSALVSAPFKAVFMTPGE